MESIDKLHSELLLAEAELENRISVCKQLDADIKRAATEEESHRKELKKNETSLGEALDVLNGAKKQLQQRELEFSRHNLQKQIQEAKLEELTKLIVKFSSISYPTECTNAINSIRAISVRAVKAALTAALPSARNVQAEIEVLKEGLKERELRDKDSKNKLLGDLQGELQLAEEDLAIALASIEVFEAQNTSFQKKIAESGAPPFVPTVTTITPAEASGRLESLMVRHSSSGQHHSSQQPPRAKCGSDSDSSQGHHKSNSSSKALQQLADQPKGKSTKVHASRRQAQPQQQQSTIDQWVAAEEQSGASSSSDSDGGPSRETSFNQPPRGSAAKKVPLVEVRALTTTTTTSHTTTTLIPVAPTCTPTCVPSTAGPNSPGLGSEASTVSWYRDKCLFEDSASAELAQSYMMTNRQKVKNALKVKDAAASAATTMLDDSGGEQQTGHTDFDGREAAPWFKLLKRRRVQTVDNEGHESGGGAGGSSDRFIAGNAQGNHGGMPNSDSFYDLD